jgi:hypothetical protein
MGRAASTVEPYNPHPKGNAVMPTESSIATRGRTEDEELGRTHIKEDVQDRREDRVDDRREDRRSDRRGGKTVVRTGATTGARIVGKIDGVTSSKSCGMTSISTF